MHCTTRHLHHTLAVACQATLRRLSRFNPAGRIGVVLCCTASAFPIQAANLNVVASDTAGSQLLDAVVYAEPAARRPFPKPAGMVEIQQKAKQFFPLVTVVQSGTPVLFPNLDTVRHHVYSFSPSKTFELKLYSGVPSSPVEFDKAGTVVVGCNIHDRMVAYIHIVDTPYFGKTDASGRVRLEGLPPGKYTLKGWHHRLAPGARLFEQSIDVQTSDIDVPVRIGVASSGD